MRAHPLKVRADPRKLLNHNRRRCAHTRDLCCSSSRSRAPSYLSEYPCCSPCSGLELRSGNQSSLADQERASYRLLQIVMDNPPEAERKVGADMNCGDDLENR